MLLETMTSAEIRTALAEGRRDVVVPCGAVEQHGRHLPLDVDAVHADRLGAVGRGARSAVGMAELPFDIAVEIEAVVRVSP